MFMASLICNMDVDCEKFLVCKMELECVKTLQFDTEVIQTQEFFLVVYRCTWTQLLAFFGLTFCCIHSFI